MNKNILIVIGGAIAIAILVAVLVQLTLGGKKPDVVEEAKVEILVAAKDIKIGQELAAGDVRWQSWPKGALFGGAVTRKDNQLAEDVFKGRVSRDISKDEPFTKNLLVGESKGNFVAASLEPGQRAVAIEVSAASMVGGFIGPGDFVDVILTYQLSLKVDKENPVAEAVAQENLDKIATETIVQNVKVLAVDQSATRPEDDKIKVGKTITLALDVKQAEQIALAQEMGNLTLSLRGVGDDVVVKKDWPTVSDMRLTKVDDEIQTEYREMQNGSGAVTNTMRIYNGDQVNSIPAR